MSRTDRVCLVKKKFSECVTPSSFELRWDFTDGTPDFVLFIAV